MSAAEAFLFGLTTGIAVAATASYALSAFALLRDAPRGAPRPAFAQAAGRRARAAAHAAAAARAAPAASASTAVAVDADAAHAAAAAAPAADAHDDDDDGLWTPGAARALARLESAFRVPKQKLHEIVKHFAKEMDRGLAAPNQTLKMIPSFVVNLPKGSETGTYLALDLGGSNFRVCEVTLEGAGSSGAVSNVRMRQRKYVVSDDLKTGRGTDLFDFFADCVREFLVENGIHATDPAHNELVLGFTFSFPCSQTAINKGALMHWTKGFTASGVEGQDPVQLLQDAFHRKQLRVRVASLVNDTVGTLVAHAYQDPSTHLGIILGTGTNAAYVERIDRIPKWDGPIPASGKMIVNTEWGAFDQEGVVLPLTSYDSVLDRQSAHPHLQTYEKMVSGLYLGEVMRLVLADLASTGELFRGVSSTVLTTPYSIDTALMSRIERDHSAELADVRVVLEDLISIPKTSAEDRRIVKRVAELIGTRSARLAAAGVAAIVSKINRLDDCTVAIDGSLFEHYPHYANRMRDALREIVGIAADNILLVQARDGSGQGAALIAALADA